MKKTFLFPVLHILLFLACIALFSCKKDSPSDDDNNNNDDNADLCTRLAAVKAHPVAVVATGQPIEISVDSLAGADYYWTGPGYYESYDQNNVITDYADYTYRGWYYVRISHEGCTSRFDSVYVDVKLPQGAPSCTPANNTATFNGGVLLGDQEFYFVSFENVLGDYEVTGNSSNGDINLKFSAYWLTHDLEDGIYYTTSIPSLEYGDIDKVYINDVNQSIYWVADPDKPVYISHVNGKQRITFCGIQFSGDWGGTLYHTTVSAKITQP